MIRIRIWASATLLVACAILAGCNSSAPAGVAATVNGRPVYTAEVDRTYKSQFPGKAEGENEDQVQLRRLEMLRSLIDNEIMLQRAEKAALVATDADVESRLTEMKTPYSKEEFEKQLQDWGLSLDELKARVRKDESVKKLFNKEITSRINITDTEVSAFYNANRGMFNLPEPQVHLAQIVVTPRPDPNVRNLKNDKARTDDEAMRKIKPACVRARISPWSPRAIRKTRRRRRTVAISASFLSLPSTRRARISASWCFLCSPGACRTSSAHPTATAF